MRIVGIMASLLTILVSAAPSASAEPKQLPKLYKGAATDFTGRALIREFPFTEDAGSRDIACNQRINRVRYRCEVSFGAGDVGFKGGIKVRYIVKAGNRLGYRYALRVVQTNYYCIYGLDNPREECQETVRKTGNGYA